MKSGNEEVAVSLCLKYGLRLGDSQRALKGWALTTFLRQAWGSTKDDLKKLIHLFGPYAK
jgi:hypothetical protein